MADNTQTISWQRELPVRYVVDVFVAGGGPAGLAAAATAARQGRTVFVAEALNCFGGMATAGALAIFMSFGDDTHFLADGFGREVCDRLKAAELLAFDQGEHERNVRFSCEGFKRICDEIAKDAAFDFTFQTTFLDVIKSGDRVTAALCAGKSGLFAVQATAYVDATGDGDLAARAGASFEKGDAQGNMQPGTLCSLWADIDWERAKAAGNGMWQQSGKLAQAIAEGVLSQPDLHMPGMLPMGPHTGIGNIGHSFGLDGTSERSLTDAVVRARQLLTEYQRYYQRYLTGYERMELVATAALMGVRESRRILGDYVLTAADYGGRAVFEDEIGRYNYWVDVHPAKPTQEEFRKHAEYAQMIPLREGESYGIPYRSLTPHGLRNVVVAGRCISADRIVQASIRVMPGCFITGQAAGLAAALAAEGDGDVRAIRVPELQRRLAAMGAYLPNRQA